MTRLLATIRNDVIVQAKNRLYAIGIFAAVLVGIPLAIVTNPDQLVWALPSILLLLTGGTTFLYVAGMILFEKDEGTLNAQIVSPLRPSEYLLSKLISLTLLATLESLVLIGIVSQFQGYNLLSVLLGIFLIGTMYVLAGIVMIVRYKSITDFLIPAIAVSLVLQAPALYFLNVLDSPLFLIIPTSAPVLLMQSGWAALSNWEWLYILLYSVVVISLMAAWAYRAFDRHIVLKAG